MPLAFKIFLEHVVRLTDVQYPLLRQLALQCYSVQVQFYLFQFKGRNIQMNIDAINFMEFGTA